MIKLLIKNNTRRKEQLSTTQVQGKGQGISDTNQKNKDISESSLIPSIMIVCIDNETAG